MRLSIIYPVFALLLTACTANTQGVNTPLSDGEYSFAHKYAEAEHYRIKSITLDVTIDGAHITVINNDRAGVFPLGILEQGTLMWHAVSGQWIISHTPGDAQAPEVGGCSGGPTVVDLENRIYWTC